MPKNELSWWDFANHFSRGLRLGGLWPLYERDSEAPPEPSYVPEEDALGEEDEEAR